MMGDAKAWIDFSIKFNTVYSQTNNTVYKNTHITQILQHVDIDNFFRLHIYGTTHQRKKKHIAGCASLGN